jgi:hypothetical protein
MNTSDFAASAMIMAALSFTLTIKFSPQKEQE